MDTCAGCGHALEAHLKGEGNNRTCACCRWEEPWELPVDDDTNPFYAMDEDKRVSGPRGEA